MIDKKNIVVAGGGAFGTALALVLASDDQAKITLLVRDETRAANMARTRVNSVRLPDIKLPSRLLITADINVLQAADIILSVVPSKAQQEFTLLAKPHLKNGATFVICSKGFDPIHGGLVSDNVRDILVDQHLAILSGPGFAVDIAKGLPTAMTLAADEIKFAEELSHIISRKNFRLYASDDPIGVQTGGALKNVLAIAAGIVVGAKLGDSARASVIARGLAELSRYIVYMGGKPETASGLAALGDLVLTASSEQSRNYRFGIAIGQGTQPSDLIGEGNPLVEGANAALAAADIAQSNNIALPLTKSVADIISGQLEVTDAISQLLARPLRNEN